MKNKGVDRKMRLKIGRLYIEWGKWSISKRPYIGMGVFNSVPKFYEKPFLCKTRLTFKSPF